MMSLVSLKHAHVGVKRLLRPSINNPVRYHCAKESRQTRTSVCPDASRLNERALPPRTPPPDGSPATKTHPAFSSDPGTPPASRSEERRVGQERPARIAQVL